MTQRMAAWFWSMIVAVVWSLTLAGAAAYFVAAGMNGDNPMLYGIAAVIAFVWYAGVCSLSKGGR